MKQPIQISLAGDGRVLVLTPKTVRKAFFQFTRLNRLAWQDKYLFERASEPNPNLTLRDILHRDSWVDEESSYLSQKDIQTIEHQLNRLLLQQERVLVEGEKRLYYGHVGVRGWGQNRQKVYYLVRYGMIFVLEQIPRDTLVSFVRRELWLEQNDHHFQFVYYEGTSTDLAQARLVLQFRNRFDLSQAWTIPLADFTARRWFSVRRVIACEGFRIVAFPKNPLNRNLTGF